MEKPQMQEPDFQTACTWWSDLPYVWTPLGWKDHLLRFSVFWNGAILAQPNLNRRAPQGNQGAQFAFRPGNANDRMARQGWNEGPAPVLWTEWGWGGGLVRQEVFAHIPGGGATQTGMEPLFAWVRLSVADLIPEVPLDDTMTWVISIQAPHIVKSMEHSEIWFNGDGALYSGALMPDAIRYDRHRGLRILEEDGKVRLGVAPGSACRARFLPPSQGSRYLPPSQVHQTAYRLELSLPFKKGADVFLLIPMLPMERAIFGRELRLGYQAALKETNRYWAVRPRSAATVTVPEPAINEAIRHSVRFSQMLTEKNPATGKYCKINGSWHYADLWTTPGAMDLIMLMDTLGHHAFVERYLDIFREEQGTVVPPGDAYGPHPGYLSTPALYKSVDWLSDNGAILYTLSMHGLLSGNRDFIERFTDTLVKSCEWIGEMRARRGHGGYEGILPAAVATDEKTKIQALWSDAWNYKGLCVAARLLARSGHPRADEFAAEAAAYRAAFLKILRAKCAGLPVWTDARGRKHRLVLNGDQREGARSCLYLDSGPLFLVFAGILPATDPMMRDVLAWFRAGPQRKFFRPDASIFQVPALEREIASFEPCYSWNVFHSWQLGDREKFLEGMYSLFAGSLSRQTYVSCESRGGVTGNVFSAPLAIYLARLAMADDQLNPGELHLLRLMPSAWLKPGSSAVFGDLPTEFGPVTLKTRMAPDGKTLAVEFRQAFRKGQAPRRIVLHRPPVARLQTLKLNGKNLKGAHEMRVIGGQ